MPRRIRQIRVEGNTAYVPLTHGYEAMIDASDVHLVNKSNWQARLSDRSTYACRSFRDNERQTTFSMHRVLMDAPIGLEVDHIDCNGLNNRRSNLRVVTRSQNMCNTRPSIGGASELKGAIYHKARRKWVSFITLEKKTLYLGIFATPEEAHAAYCEASARLHGEFGRTS